MAYTDPTTRANGFVVGATEWNADIVQNIKFLADPPRCSAYRSSDLSIVTATETILTLNAEHWDTNSMHSTSVDAGRFVAPVAGIYDVKLSVFFAQATTGYRQARIYKNGVGVDLETEATNDNPSASTTTSLVCQKEISLLALEYVECSVFHTRGSNLSVLGSGSRNTYCQVRMVSQA